MKKKLRYILLVLTPGERKRFWLQTVLDILISIADVGALVLLLLVINFYINNTADRLSFLPSWLLDPDSINLIAFFFIVFSIKNILGILITLWQFRFVAKVAVRISQQKLASYQQGNFETFIAIDSSSHLRKIAYQPFDFCQHVVAGVQTILTQSTLIFLTVVVIMVYDAQLFLFLLIILVPPVVLVFFYIKKRLSHAKKNILVQNEKSHKYLFDALKGYVEGNLYQRNEFFNRRYTAARKVFSRHLFESLAIQTMPARLIESFAVLGLFILIVIAKSSGVHDSSALIMIGAFMAASYKIIPGIVKIINASGQMKAYEVPVAEKEDETLTEKMPGSTHPIELLQMKNVCFRYGGNTVLENFSLTVQKGDMLGITGRSGKGKTTILNLLLGFLSPASGSIFINNSPVSSPELKSFWPEIAYVRQQPFFIHDTIVNNITLHEDGFDENKLRRVIQVAGLSDLVDQSAEGIHSVVTENGKNISGGQQQRITLARALYKDANLILLDEPFNELDDSSALCLAQHFKDMTRNGKTVIMITHDSKCLSYCNKIISLDEQ